MPIKICEVCLSGKFGKACLALLVRKASPPGGVFGFLGKWPDSCFVRQGIRCRMIGDGVGHWLLMVPIPLRGKVPLTMLNFILDPRTELPEPFTERAFRGFRDKLPNVTFGTHAGLTFFLGYLIDLSNRHASVDRWFRCTQETAETDLGLAPPTQKRLLALLEELDYIEVQHIGKAPPVRYLRTNLDAIEHDLIAEPVHADS